MKTNASKIFKLAGAEAVLTEAQDLRQYLTGLSTTFGYVLTDKDGTVFYTDSRYIEGATKALKDSDISVRIYENPPEKLLSKYKEVAIPVGRTLYGDYEKLKSAGLKRRCGAPRIFNAQIRRKRHQLRHNRGFRRKFKRSAPRNKFKKIALRRYYTD